MQDSLLDTFLSLLRYQGMKNDKTLLYCNAQWEDATGREIMKVWIAWMIRTNSHYGTVDGVALIAGIYADYKKAQEASKKLGEEAGTIEEFEVQ